MPPPTAAEPARRLRARRGDGERLREEILEAAEAILLETGDQSALSIRAVAGRVGVTPPSIYLHFADRNDLLYAVAERRFSLLEGEMDAAAAGVDDPRERLHRRGQAYLHFALEHPEHYRLLMMTRPDATPERLRDERLADTAGLTPVVADLRAAMDAGLIADRPELEVAELLWMVAHGAASLLLSKPEFPFGDPDEVYERLFGLLWAGLAGSPPLTTLSEGAARMGGHRWCELALWELLGSWAPDAAADRPAAAVALDAHAAHAAWRAAQWWDRLPVLAGVDREALTAPPSPAWEAALDAARGAATTVGRLAVAYRVLLPRLALAYDAHLASTSPAGDGPARRTLTHAGADLWADWRDGHFLLLRQLTSPELVAEAASATSAGEAPFGHPPGEAAQ